VRHRAADIDPKGWLRLGAAKVQDRRGLSNLIIGRNERRSGEMERVMGIEPTLVAWEATVLPLNYTRTAFDSMHAAAGPATLER
jgi:hypothetical protein